VANSKVTIYMRQNLLRLGMSHRIECCDGKAPHVTFTEGTNWLMNRLRELLSMNQGMTFKVFLGDDLVAVAEETNRGFDSVSFRDVRNNTGPLIGSSILKERHFHGVFDLWLVKNEASSPLPYWVVDAATLLFAYKSANAKQSTADQYRPSHFAAAPAVDRFVRSALASGTGAVELQPATNGAGTGSSAMAPRRSSSNAEQHV